MRCFIVALVVSTATASSYFFQPGYLADGHDLGELFFNINEAKNYCDNEPKCKGFTFQRQAAQSDDEPAEKVSVRFKEDGAVFYHADWQTYTKAAKGSTYFYNAGYMGDGDEPISPGFMTLADAKKECDKNRKCQGFTVETQVPTDNGEPLQEVHVRFKSDSTITASSEYTSYTKAVAGRTASSYTFQPGYIGGETIHAAFMNMQDAQKYCDSRAACAGFTFERRVHDGSQELYMTFKDDSRLYLHTTFDSYTKDQKTEL